ncbi:helix-turn-helix domain-containing protein [Antrihabitans stalactiti]|uniref:ArsR family transcriptional regulator n=1 Tax=Antrihabitans stalactiti TaxID=2584121 RepID=A0A848KQU5_9NOCA|nr:helix-turn-helix domain-containing protein [Antrihabitans stalactiti]NMN98962.1 ArsR family transcriptional regulator [Antrihabitans stalactiti]
MPGSEEALATSDGAARRSPPTERVVQVLDFLVDHRDRRYGLSELARELDISKPTCLGIVTALVDADYLTRDAVAKSYGLGPALITAGRAAQEGLATGPIPRRHLEQLSDRFVTTCTASAVIADRITILELTAPDGMVPTAKVGQVYPFAPPVGLMYVLWNGDDALESWLAREPALPTRLDRSRLRRVVDHCRSTGYLVETLTDMGRRLHNAMAGVDARDLPPELREVLGEMVSSLGERVYLEGDDDGSHPVSLIAAPTYDADGKQALVLTLYVGSSIDQREITRRGRALVETADEITAAAGGRKPPPVRGIVR